MIEITKDKETTTQFTDNYPRGLRTRVIGSVCNIYILYILLTMHIYNKVKKKIAKYAKNKTVCAYFNSKKAV